MTYDPTGHLLLNPVDKEASARARRLRELGLGERPDPAFDAFARRLAEATGAPFSMVNFIDENRQFFAGMHTPEGTLSGSDLGAAAAGAAAGHLGRSLARDRGYCPYVVVRRKALVLEDVCDYPRFAGNPVVDEIGVRSYMGAPLIDRTGTALGAVCVFDTEVRAWGRMGLETIKAMAAELMDQIHRREDGLL
ncbi:MULTISPECIES: GAF domain-containing protein [unclassified Streptomyces]|uniref:GAF domain-containing protein n=1 Tax=unclassified Streptomyces TaxID=2593676 RepID=UPI001660E421|nr:MULTISPECIES: GAF domain-containing protein [unclassified Streptomyces]MBD0711574.1 histidine kinase [Streptomyces sp. CBMA291]MBD0716578.1 histidine kinase [Streptomyces sp. CBMA370]